MLQEFLRRGKKWADKPDSNVREGSIAELGICSRPAWGSAYCGKSSKRPPWKWWIFRFIFAVDFLVAKCKRKIRRKKSAGKSSSRKQKICRRTTPPRNPPARPINPPQNLPTNPPVKPPSTRRVFSIEKVFSWRRLQSMDSGTLFGCLLGMVKASTLKCICNPSAAAGGMDKVCCALFQTTLLVRIIRFEKTAKKKPRKIHHATLPTLAAQVKGNSRKRF